MGTRADFYVGRGTGAMWLGSIAWDGYPKGIDSSVLAATTQGEFVQALSEFFKHRDDVSLANHDGWPWPWENSHTTDFAYAFDGGSVWVSMFGSAWKHSSQAIPPKDADDDTKDNWWGATHDAATVFPDMSHIKDVARDERSGLLFFGCG